MLSEPLSGAAKRYSILCLDSLYIFVNSLEGLTEPHTAGQSDMADAEDA